MQSITNISIFISHLKRALGICQFETNAAELKSILSEKQSRLLCVVGGADFGTNPAASMNGEPYFFSNPAPLM